MEKLTKEELWAIDDALDYSSDRIYHENYPASDDEIKAYESACKKIKHYICDLDDEPATDFDWDLNEIDNTATITGYKGQGGEVIIPRTVESGGNTYTVTSIGRWAFWDCSSLTSVIIPNSVTSIGWYAFSYCTSLTSVIIPDSVTSIGELAFVDCHGLTSVTIGSGVTSIGELAFRSCSRLTDTSGAGGSYGFKFNGTMEDWKMVVRNEGWHYGTPTEKIQCSDGVCGLDDKITNKKLLGE